MSEPVHWSLGYFKAQGYSITAYCDELLPGGLPCGHSARLDLDALIATLGPDFRVVEQRERFLASLKCARCNSRRVSIQLGSPAGYGRLA
jgi:hypothetical protein